MYLFTQRHEERFFPGSQPGEDFTRGHILDTYFVDLSKTSTLPSLSPTQRHESHDYTLGHTLGGGGRLCIVFTLWILGIVFWKLYLERKKNLGQKRLLFGYGVDHHYSLFFRVQIDVGSHSISRRGV